MREHSTITVTSVAGMTKGQCLQLGVAEELVKVHKIIGPCTIVIRSVTCLDRLWWRVLSWKSWLRRMITREAD